jgi:7-cyano-7-deazaguanine synthase
MTVSEERGKVVVLMSGGMDSAALAWLLADEGNDLHCLSFDYGQGHREREQAASWKLASNLGARWDSVRLPITDLLKGSALTDPDVEVPDGHYADETMKITVVPNRNAVMLSIAFAAAVADEANGVAFAAHGGDHFIYPDCRPGFVKAFQEMQNVATEGFGSPVLQTPFINKTKSDIVAIGDPLGVPWAETWSCYKGGDYHCGTCGTCTERREAFQEAGVTDPTTYA